jgi:hypothetical protein
MHIDPEATTRMRAVAEAVRDVAAARDDDLYRRLDRAGVAATCGAIARALSQTYAAPLGNPPTRIHQLNGMARDDLINVLIEAVDVVLTTDEAELQTRLRAVEPVVAAAIRWWFIGRRSERMSDPFDGLGMQRRASLRRLILAAWRTAGEVQPATSDLFPVYLEVLLLHWHEAGAS